MTKFEDQLYEQLMTEHGHHLRAPQHPASASSPVPARRRVPRPVWLATGAAGVAASVTAGVMVLGGAPAMAAYSVSQHHGAVTVAVSRPSGVAGANTVLHSLDARVKVVPVRPGCPAISSLPRPQPEPHASVLVTSGVDQDGHRSVTVKVGQGGIPAGDTMILAFADTPGGGSLGAGGVITGPVPSCVSLTGLQAEPPAPPAPSGGSSG